MTREKSAGFIMEKSEPLKILMAKTSASFFQDPRRKCFLKRKHGKTSQFPVRPAWAITIHKSQGLTFSKAIIDAGESFAPGQVYVALSRLTSLAGLVLYSRIHPSSINTDTRVIEFTRLEQEEDQLAQELQQE